MQSSNKQMNENNAEMQNSRNMINTDKNNRKIDTNNVRKTIVADLLYADLTYKIRGAIFEIYNNLGFGHKEQVYQKALVSEFDAREIPYQRELNLKVNYKGMHIGNYRPDFLVDGKIIIELKAVEFMPKTFETQLINYLKATEFQLGLLVNFGGTKLYIKRLVWTGYPLTQREFVSNQRKSKFINQRKSSI